MNSRRKIIKNTNEVLKKKKGKEPEKKIVQISNGFQNRIDKIHRWENNSATTAKVEIFNSLKKKKAKQTTNIYQIYININI